MATVTLAEAKAHLEELVSHLSPGDAIVITEGDKPVAQIVPPPTVVPRQRKLGFLKGVLEIVSDDDEHLDDFKEYM